jgi:hypothetical protein
MGFSPSLPRPPDHHAAKASNRLAGLPIRHWRPFVCVWAPLAYSMRVPTVPINIIELPLFQRLARDL